MTEKLWLAAIKLLLSPERPGNRIFSSGSTTRLARKGRCKMPLTRSFKETVQARVRRDPAFRAALLTEGVQALLAGDLDTGKARSRA